MRLRHLRSGTALAVVLAMAGPAAALGAGPPDGPVPAGEHHGALGHSGPIRSVTLITGDRVLFTGGGSEVSVVAVQQPAERRGIGWVRTWDDTGVSVLPSDALPLLAAGRLDERLFHVTGLVAQGLADDEQEDLRLIVTDGAGEGEDVELFDAAALPEMAEVATSSADLGVTGVSVPRSDTGEFWSELNARPTTLADSAGKVWLDGRVRSTLAESAPLVGAPEAWEAGHTGAGVRVAVLDTGYDTDHPDLSDRVIDAKSFVAGAPVHDGAGHGTHVAGIIAGSGAASDGRHRGVAPEAELLIGKVLNDGGGFESDIIAGMEWAAENGARVVNMSLGAYSSPSGDPMVDALDSLSETHGTLFVTAAGNDGLRGSVGSPAVADSSLAVGSTTKQDELSDFSSQGPRPWDFGLKPEIAAPGTDITAAGAAATGSDYVSMSGTSMAAPHVAGAAAIVAQAHPEATGEELKALLVNSAQPLADISVHGQGAGRLDVERATNQRLRAEPAALGVGRLPWPHDAAEPTVRTVTYHNPTPEDVELTLSVDVEGAQDVVALDAESITVPTRGSVEVDVLVTPSNEAVGEYTGRVIAESGETRLVTPLSVHVEPESYDVPIEFTDSAGDPVNGLFILQDHTTGATTTVWSDEGPQARLSAGEYRVIGFGIRFAAGEPAAENTAFALDRFTVEPGAALRLSGQDGELVEIGVESTEDVTQDLASVILESTTHPDSPIGIQADAVRENLVVPSGSVPGLEYHYSGFWGVPWASATVLGDDGFTVGWALEQSIEGHDLETAGTVIDITGMDPEKVPDLTGLIPLIADTEYALDAARLAALVAASRDNGAELVLSSNHIEDLSVLPVVQLYRQNDVERLLSRMASGPTDIAVTLTAQSPVSYHLADSVFDGLSAEATDWRFDTAELAEVESAQHHPLGTGREWAIMSYAVDGGVSYMVESPRRTPHRRTDYYSPDVEWAAYSSLGYRIEGDDIVDFPALQTVPEARPAGPNPAHDLWVGPLGPSLPTVRYSADGLVPPVFRRDDVLTVEVPMFGDNEPRNVAFPNAIDTGSTVLEHDGVEIGRSESAGHGSFDLPASSDGWFELTATGVRDADWWPVSTEVDARWRFRSAPAEPGTIVAPRLLDVRFDLDLDGTNSAAAETPVTGSVTASAAEGESPVTDLRVSYSLDDGASWHAASTRQEGESWTVEIPAAAEGEHVSLRVAAEDDSGHSVIETITKAYAVK
ncbi:subtilisin family serine protease [Actinoalloteichus hoggarensis]|uniref:Subtilisin BL n=1 Tax=Actinoalloteichus hoggarensis TaxID=1470176 RepID=A0A221W6L3_9PSEU|nr:S8 family serine peptidase [Actinoalloteichus hoggarensis]ASO21286.1 Subtilisin BL [Actinoalloteichus hoggarensis]MBB5921218.1 subtilisin family serine protease [Actinoalloteichus hoggarensis]